MDLIGSNSIALFAIKNPSYAVFLAQFHQSRSSQDLMPQFNRQFSRSLLCFRLMLGLFFFFFARLTFQLTLLCYFHRGEQCMVRGNTHQFPFQRSGRANWRMRKLRTGDGRGQREQERRGSHATKNRMPKGGGRWSVYILCFFSMFLSCAITSCFSFTQI